MIKHFRFVFYAEVKFYFSIIWMFHTKQRSEFEKINSRETRRDFFTCMYEIFDLKITGFSTWNLYGIFAWNLQYFFSFKLMGFFTWNLPYFSLVTYGIFTLNLQNFLHSKLDGIFLTCRIFHSYIQNFSLETYRIFLLATYGIFHLKPMRFFTWILQDFQLKTYRIFSLLT